MYPTDPNWRLFFWDSSTITDIFYDIEFIGQVDPSMMRLWGVSGSPTILVLRPNIGKAWTVEADIIFDQLPADFSDLDNHRVGLVVMTDEDTGQGLVFSDIGIAWATDDVPQPIEGSQGLITLGIPYRIRIVSDTDGLINVYITAYPSLPNQELVFQTTVQSDEEFDRVQLEVVGSDSEIHLLEWKGDWEPKNPSDPPEVVTSVPKVIRVGEYLLLDARRSTSPSGHLNYKWRLISAPSSSQFVDIGLGHTGHSSSLPALEYEIICDGVFPESTTVGDIMSVVSYGWSDIDPHSFDTDGHLTNPDRLSLVVPILPKDTQIGWTILHQAVINDPTAALTFASPDVPGVWIFELTVTDPVSGFSSSETIYVEVEQSVLLSSSPLDLSVIWKIIGSQWEYVEDRERIQAVWEALSLAMSSMLLYLWQVNASKSIAKIPREFVRKWWRLGTFVDKVFFGTTNFENAPLPRFSIEITSPIPTKPFKATVAGEDYIVEFSSAILAIDQIVDEINQTIPGFASVDGNRIKFSQDRNHFVIRSDGFGSDLGFTDDAYSYWVLNVETKDNPDPSESKRRTLTLQHPDGVTTYFDMISYLSVDGELYRIDQLNGTEAILDRPLPKAGTFEAVAASILSQDLIDFDELGVVTKDTVRFLRGDAQQQEEWEIVGSDSTKLMLLPKQAAEYQGDRTLAGLTKRDHIPVFEGVVSIPTLRDEVETATMVYHESVDYTITVGPTRSWIDFVSDKRADAADGYWAEFVYLSADEKVYDNFGYTVELEPGQQGPNDYLSAISGLFYMAFRVPAIGWLQDGVNIVAGLPVVEEDGTIIYIDDTWSPDYGRILISHQSRIRTYLYPLSVGLGTNPETGREWSVGDEVAAWSCLAAGVEITDGHQWGQRFGLDWLREVHSYMVTVDASVVSPEVASRLLDYLDRVSPVWTKPYLSSVRTVEDGIDFQSDMSVWINWQPQDYVGEPLPDAWVPVAGDGNRYNQMLSVADSGRWSDRLMPSPSIGPWVTIGRAYQPGSVITPVTDRTLWFWETGMPWFPDDGVSFLAPLDSWDGVNVDAKPQNWWGAMHWYWFLGIGTVTVDTTNQKYGDGCYHLTGSGSYLWLYRYPMTYVLAEMWFRRDAALGVGDFQIIMQGMDPTSSTVFYLFQMNIGGGMLLGFQVYSDISSDSASWTSDLCDGDWHNIAVHVDRQGVTLFIDGAFQVTLSPAGTIPYLQDIYFGGSPWSNTDALVDQIVIRGSITRPAVHLPSPHLHRLVYIPTGWRLLDIRDEINELFPDLVEAETVTDAIGERLVIHPKVRWYRCGGTAADELGLPSCGGIMAEPIFDIPQDQYNLPNILAAELTETYAGSPPRADSIFYADTGIHADLPLTGVQTTTRILTT